MSKIKKTYFIIVLIMVFFVSTICFTYAFFSNINEEHGKLNIVAGTIDYKIESAQLENNKVTVGFNETKVIDIKLTSLNSIDSKYEIYYNYITSLTATEISNINIGYTTTNKDSISGKIEANKSKNIRVYINNSNDKDIEIEFNVKGGLLSNELTITDGIKLVNNDITVPDYDIKTETIDGKTYAVIDTYDSQSGVASVEYNGQIQTLPKNRDDYKIYISHNSFYSTDAVLKKLNKYKNVVTTTTMGTTDEIIAGNYNLVIDYQSYWNVNTSKLEYFFQNGINIYSHGNGTNNIFFISDTIGASNANLQDLKAVNDRLLVKLINYNGHTSDGGGQVFIKFNEDVEVWYQGIYDDIVYDAMGYYKQNDIGWIHNQSLVNSMAFEHIADFLLKINTAEYQITESGDYTFKVTDYAGNVNKKTVHIDIE